MFQVYELADALAKHKQRYYHYEVGNMLEILQGGERKRCAGGKESAAVLTLW